MTAEVPLRQIEVSGLTSIGHAVLDLSSEVTLLVGPNGAGKSNVVDAFEMLGRVIDRQLNDHLVRTGGFAAILHRPTDPALTPDAVEIEVWGDWNDDASNGYRVQIEPATDDTALVRETTMYHRSNFPEPHTTPLAAARESRLRAEAEQDAKARYVLRVVAGCRVFHFDDTSRDAPPKKRVDPADNLTLAPTRRTSRPSCCGFGPTTLRGTGASSVLVTTSRRADGKAFKGGGTTWRHYEADLRKLLNATHFRHR